MLGLGNIMTGGAVLDSEYSPLALGSTLLAWYAFNQGQTNLSGTDGNADNQFKWEDSSGSGRHATQNTDAAKPTFTDGYVEFDDASTSDTLLIATGDGALQFGHVQSLTISLGIKRTSTSNGDRFLGTNTSEFCGMSGTDTKFQFRSGGSLIAATYASGTFPAATDFVLTFTKDDNGLVTVYKNNDELTVASGSAITADAANDDDLSVSRVGGNVANSTSNFDGRMYEMVICDTVLSDADRNNVINRIKNKMGI